MSTPVLPAYGYAHRARVVRLGAAEETYLVEVPAIAPGILSGPFMSAVRDLQPGDQVLVLQVGPTSGDLVIVCRLPERAPDFTLPIEISDVTGLAAALDDRATDAELDALADATNLNFLVVNDALDDHDGRLDVLETARTALEAADVALAAADTALDARLDIVEPAVTANTAATTANGTAIGLLNTWAWRNQDHGKDVYGDLVDFGEPRSVFNNTRTVGGGVALITRTRVRRDTSVSFIRLYCTTAGVGASGLTTGAIYTSATALGTYTRVASGTVAATVTGRLNVTVPATALTAGTYVLVLITSNGYTSAPVWAGSGVAAIAGLINPTGGIVWATKSGITVAPTTIDPQDGTWSAQAAPWWVTLS